MQVAYPTPPVAPSIKAFLGSGILLTTSFSFTSCSTTLTFEIPLVTTCLF